MQIAVIGGGAWGTALALLLSRAGHSVRLWVYEPQVVSQIRRKRENETYLPGFPLPPSLKATDSLSTAAAGSELFIFAVPSHAARSVVERLARYVKSDLPVVSATKGFDPETLSLISDLLSKTLGRREPSGVAVLSGPSFAREVAAGQPTALSLACLQRRLALSLMKILTTETFRLFLSRDMIGVQLGGALKNVIALAAGGSDGLGYGENTRAALITRGLWEMTRLGTAMGADWRTFYGLSGMGDLFLTCNSDFSRNHTLGFRLGRGEKLPAILANLSGVAEGVTTARTALALGRKYHVDMPITREVCAVLFEDKPPDDAVRALIRQAKGDEFSDPRSHRRLRRRRGAGGG